MLQSVKPPLVVRPLTDEEHHHTPAQITKVVGCSVQTVRNDLHAFAQSGLACLTEQSSIPHTSSLY